MGIEQHDFIGFRTVDLADVPQAQHVFGVLALAFVAHARLRHHEGLEPFFAKLGQHGGGGDIGVSLRTAFMRRVREDGRRYAVNLVIGQWVIARSEGEREAKREASCMFILLTKRVCC